MVNYLSKPIQGPSDIHEPLRALTRKEVQFNWTSSHEKQFNIIKQAVSSTATLRYYDVDKAVTLQVDAYKVRLS